VAYRIQYLESLVPIHYYGGELQEEGPNMELPSGASSLTSCYPSLFSGIPAC